MKPILTTGEAAEYCGVHYRTVIRWIEKGHLKGYKLPGRGDNRIKLEDFLDFLAKNNMPIPEILKKEEPKIVVITTNDDMANVIARHLKHAGYESLLAHNGFQAGTLLTLIKPKLIVLDLTIPGASSLEILQFIRKQETFHHIKILVISGIPACDLQKVLNYTADDMLKKPFDSDALIRKVKLLIES